MERGFPWTPGLEDSTEENVAGGMQRFLLPSPRVKLRVNTASHLSRSGLSQLSSASRVIIRDTSQGGVEKYEVNGFFHFLKRKLTFSTLVFMSKMDLKMHY